jgi:hypothetical protein
MNRKILIVEVRFIEANNLQMIPERAGTIYATSPFLFLMLFKKEILIRESI